MRNDRELAETWSPAIEMDPSIRWRRSDKERLVRKFIPADTFSRAQMFERMAARQTSVLKGSPRWFPHPFGTQATGDIVRALNEGFEPGDLARVQTGPSREIKLSTVHDVMQRWMGGRAIVGVTDLHVRETRLERALRLQSLSDYNLLTQGSRVLASHEMMTLVIASRRQMTDSHSDDPDGVNHCFVGKKLWLAWDTLEGIAAGLEDMSRQSVYSDAKFDMKAFLRLRSSHWFIVEGGNTLFMPGHLTHKVFTLEPYLGIGSFNLALPNCLSNLTRWMSYGPMWKFEGADGNHCVPDALRVCLRVMQRCIDGSNRVRERWGFEHSGSAYRHWLRKTPRKYRYRATQNEEFRELLALFEQYSSGPRPASTRRGLGAAHLQNGVAV